MINEKLKNISILTLINNILLEFETKNNRVKGLKNLFLWFSQFEENKPASRRREMTRVYVEK